MHPVLYRAIHRYTTSAATMTPPKPIRPIQKFAAAVSQCGAEVRGWSSPQQ